MKYEDFIAEEEARDPEFRAEREKLRPLFRQLAAQIEADPVRRERLEKETAKYRAEWERLKAD